MPSFLCSGSAVPDANNVLPGHAMLLSQMIIPLAKYNVNLPDTVFNIPRAFQLYYFYIVFLPYSASEVDKTRRKRYNVI